MEGPGAMLGTKGLHPVASGPSGPVRSTQKSLAWGQGSGRAIG